MYNTLMYKMYTTYLLPMFYNDMVPTYRYIRHCGVTSETCFFNGFIDNTKKRLIFFGTVVNVHFEYQQNI